jgi:N-glycosylase/DNA lyase
MSTTIIIRALDDAKTRAIRHGVYHDKVRELLDSGLDVIIKVGRYNRRRSLEQNDMMWRLLHALSESSDFTVPVMDVMAGKLASTHLSADDMKDYMTAQFMFESKVEEQRRPLMAIVGNGTMVMLGLRTSKLSMKRMSEFIEFLQAKCAEHGIDVE